MRERSKGRVEAAAGGAGALHGLGASAGICPPGSFMRCRDPRALFRSAVPTSGRAGRHVAAA